MNKPLGMVLLSAACVALGLGQTARGPRTAVRALEQTVEGSVLHLKGAVEIKTSRVVVQADEATFDVASGLIEANGNIRLMKAGSRTPPRPVAQVKRMRMDVNKPDLVILMVADAAAPARL